MHDDAQAQKARIAGLYNTVAAQYDQIGPAVFTHFGQCITELAHIYPGARVLDVATGRGANLFAAARQVGETGQVVGIDLAEKMVEATAAHAAHLGLKNVRVMQMDAEHLTFEDAAFDRILCNFAIFFFHHLEQTLSGFQRVLCPQGKLAMTLPAGNDDRWAWYEELLQIYYDRYHMPLEGLGAAPRRELAEYRQLLTDAGFINFQSQLMEIEFAYTNEDEWWAAKWTHGARTPLERMPPTMLTEFTAEVKSRMKSLKQQNGYHEKWRVHGVIVTKP